MVVVQCPGCPTRLSAPEGAAGKQLKCPKCGALATVPNEQVVETKPAPAPKPKSKVTADPVDDDDDDRPRSRKRRDDDDDDDDRPRKKKRRDEEDDDYDHDRKRRASGGRGGRGSGGGGGKMAVMIVVGLIALVGVGVAIFMLVGKGGLTRKAPPPGWKEVNNAEAGVRGFFPTDPMVIGNRGNFGFGAGMNIPGFGEIPQLDSSHVLTCGAGLGGRNGVIVSVQVTRFRGSLPRAMRDAVGDGFGGRFGGGDVKNVRWLGGSGVEMRVGGEVVRQVYTDKAIVQATVSGAKPEEVEAFFDNLELTK